MTLARKHKLPVLVLGLAVLCPSLSGATEPSAAPGVRLSPNAVERLTDAAPAAADPEIPAPQAGESIVRLDSGIFVGRVVRSTNPYHPQARYSVLDQGTLTRSDGARYAGRFLFFHENWGEHAHWQEDWDWARDGRYLLVGSRIDRNGTIVPGIYRAEVIGDRSISDFTPADESYLAWFEDRYAGQVRAFKQEQAGDNGSGLSFGQALALGLGAAALTQADIPSADAVEIGGAFAADVLSGGQTDALGSVAAPRQPATGNDGTATTDNHRQETVTVSCPSGISSGIPISYRTQACRSAMIDFARVYSCNMIDDFDRVAQQCRSACGDAQCRE